MVTSKLFCYTVLYTSILSKTSCKGKRIHIRNQILSSVHLEHSDWTDPACSCPIAAASSEEILVHCQKDLRMLCLETVSNGKWTAPSQKLEWRDWEESSGSTVVLKYLYDRCWCKAQMDEGLLSTASSQVI